LKFSALPIDGAWLIELEPRSDERGFFARTWCAEEFRKHDLVAAVAQINTAVSARAGTLRGLHYQVAPHLEAKTVRCTRGRVFDVIADLRPDSLTYLTWWGTELDPSQGRQLHVPAGCAHGYLTLEPDSELMYLASVPYAPASARGLRFDDPVLGIGWPRAVEVISEADRSWPLLKR
jgi:dTDP-4-dehydrorhamnose 3,5-epimerase